MDGRSGGKPLATLVYPPWAGVAAVSATTAIGVSAGFVKLTPPTPESGLHPPHEHVEGLYVDALGFSITGVAWVAAWLAARQATRRRIG